MEIKKAEYRVLCQRCITRDQCLQKENFLLMFKKPIRHDYCLSEIKKVGYQLLDKDNTDHNQYLLEMKEARLQVLFERHIKHNHLL